MTYAVDLQSSREQARTREVDTADLTSGIDSIDAAILAAVERRTKLARIVAEADAASGKKADDQAVIDRFGSLGQAGQSLGRLLIRLAHA